MAIYFYRIANVGLFHPFVFIIICSVRRRYVIFIVRKQTWDRESII